jgi:hypothetical protein
MTAPNTRFDLARIREVTDPAERARRVQRVGHELVPKMAQRLPLLNDLGGYDFASCHSP